MRWCPPATVKRAWKLLSDPERPCVAVLDCNMPGKDGLQTCDELRAAAYDPSPYTLLLLEPDPKDSLIQAAEAVADDYLIKPFQPSELRARLRAAERVAGLRAELAAAREALARETTHDALTGLLNRETAYDFLRREVARADRGDHAAGGRRGQPRQLQATERCLRPPRWRRGPARGRHSHGGQHPAIRRHRQARRG